MHSSGRFSGILSNIRGTIVLGATLPRQLFKAIQVFKSWRMVIVLLTGFSSGLPLALTSSTLQAWMADAHVNLGLIGVFALVATPYSLKFLWAPLLDRFTVPFLGRRRGWMVVCQVALALTIGLMAFSDPGKSIRWFAFLAVAVAFFSASQDVVVDAYRAEILKDEELGAGSGVNILGYRIAMIVSSAGAFALADHFSWRWVYLCMALLMGVGIFASFFAPEPKVGVKPPKTLNEAFTEPFLEFLRRKGIVEIFLFLLLYKIGAVMAAALNTPFLLELGFSKTDLAAALKTFGILATIVGTLVAGGWMTTLGIYRSLWIFGIAQGISNLAFLVLANAGKSYPIMIASIGIENLCSGMGNAAYSAFMMMLCNKRFTAAQFALLTSLMAFSRSVLTAPFGFLAQQMGWSFYFLVSTIISAPGLFLLMRYHKWQLHSEA